jgi:hypothetical protein
VRYGADNMRRLIWMVILFGGYLWLMTSGNDRIVIEKAKEAYQAIVAWLDGADIDYQTKNHKSSSSSKKPRRWD